MGKFYSDMFDTRQAGDYRDFVKFKREAVEIWLSQAEQFIGKVQEATMKIIEEKE